MASSAVARAWKGVLLACVACTLALALGCASSGENRTPADTAMEANSQSSTEDVQEGVEVREFRLSPGDRIRITVYQHPELDLAVQIPPSGRFFYPVIGELDTTGRSLEELQKAITRELAVPRPPRIGPGDRIAIRVFRNEDLSLDVFVPSNGIVSLPLAGSLSLNGKSPEQAARLIEKRLSRYLVNPQCVVKVEQSRQPQSVQDPQVTVEVLEFGGQKAFVFGEVYRPGVFNLDGATNLVELLAMAGGPTLDAEPETVVVVRKQPGAEKAEPTLVNVEAYLEGAEGGENPPVLRGDIVYVPRSFIADVDRFFIHLATIINPLVDMERAYWLGQNIEAGPPGGRSVTITP